MGKAIEIIKKNAISVVCGVVALLAVIGTFIVAGRFNSEVNTKLQTSKKTYEDVHQLNTGTFKQPALDPDKPEQPALTSYPTQKIIEKGKIAVENMRKENEALSKVARGMNQHQPLVAGLLPKASSPTLTGFKKAYYAKFNLLQASMNGTAPSNDVEVAKEEDRLWADVWSKNVQIVGGQPKNEAEVREKFEQVRAALPDQMKAERAKKFTIYVMPDAFDVHRDIPDPQTGSLPDIIDVWIGQLSLWIQEDVVKAIIETNSDASGKPIVGTERSPVKRLRSITIPKEYVTAGGRVAIGSVKTAPGVGGVAGGPPTGEAAPTEGGTAAAPADAKTRVYSLSATGRVCNPVYDVVHFNIVVDVDASKVGDFMGKLSRNRFLTILNSSIRGIDRDIAQDRAYVYGPSPVVQLSLDCEAVFFRDWTKPLMPAAIKKLLGVEETPPATPVAAN